MGCAAENDFEMHSIKTKQASSQRENRWCSQEVRDTTWADAVDFAKALWAPGWPVWAWPGREIMMACIPWLAAAICESSTQRNLFTTNLLKSIRETLCGHNVQATEWNWFPHIFATEYLHYVGGIRAVGPNRGPCGYLVIWARIISFETFCIIRDRVLSVIGVPIIHSRSCAFKSNERSWTTIEEVRVYSHIVYVVASDYVMIMP